MAGCGCACAIRVYGAAKIKDDDGFRNNCIILGVVLGAATVTFALETGYRLFLGCRHFNCAFHPFIVGYPSGVFLTVQMLLACGVLSFYQTGMLNHEDVHSLNITGPRTDDAQADAEFDRYLHAFREVATNAAVYSGAAIYVILFLGMIFSDFYLAIVS